MADAKRRADREAAQRPVRAFAFSLSFFTDPVLRRCLAALGLKPRLGLPGRGDTVLVWGRRPVARRGLAIARWRGARVLTLEDAFLRSVRTGREGDAPQGLVADDLGIYFETAAPSRLSALMDAVARDGPAPDAARLLALWRAAGLSKYNPPEPEAPELPQGAVLVLDQTRGDASIAGAGAGTAEFARMLEAAIAENPGAPVLVKVHPETAAGRRAGHFAGEALPAGCRLWPWPTAPARLFARAAKVYCVSSLAGLEAILHGQRPVVFGDAFYTGRGLTDDRHPRTRPRPALSAEGMFDAAYLRYCRWVEPAEGRALSFAEALEALGDRARAARLTHRPVVMVGMRLWKRGFLRRMFPHLIGFKEAPDRAAERAARAGGSVIVWAGRESPELREACAGRGVPLVRVEDGFIRSVGLGAELVPPASLALDDLGIYYDPSRPSRLERLIDASRELPPEALERAARLRAAVVEGGVTKYNLSGAASIDAVLEAAGRREVVLVPGQVEDDQSILRGALEIRTDADLLRAARAAFPGAFLLYKPHPDVLAGLRAGGAGAAALADATAPNVSIAALLPRVDRVATITSLAGFEALLRGVPVSVFGQPFYAGWGLTDDRCPQPPRRRPGVTLDGLTHAALIAYPAYWDPVTGLPCSPETVVRRLAAGLPNRRGAGLRLLAKVQGALATWAHLWR